MEAVAGGKLITEKQSKNVLNHGLGGAQQKKSIPERASSSSLGTTINLILNHFKPTPRRTRKTGGKAMRWRYLSSHSIKFY